MFYHAESKKERNSHINYENPLKAKQMATSSMFQSVIFKLKLAKWYSDTETVICQLILGNYKTHLGYFCL